MAGPQDVIVIEQRTGVDAGCWGGLLTTGALQLGIVGVVADGPVRDLDEAHAAEFPIFAAGTTCRTARGRVVEEGTNVPVRIGDIVVRPGDFVAADGSGVVCIAAEEIEGVLDAAEHICRKEATMAAAIRSGLATGEVLAGNYENMLRERGR
jgi:regulator of RNase E activity RraA